jgi:hypothetical protein
MVGIGAWAAMGVSVAVINSCLKCLQDDNSELDQETLKPDQGSLHWNGKNNKVIRCPEF